MNAKEYVKEYARIKRMIDAWYDKLNKLTNDYYDENVPYKKGAIVDINFNNGSTLRGIVCGDWEIDRQTGEFRPNLCKVSAEGGCGKRIYYDWKRPIESITKVCDGATCKDCLWREMRGEKMICKLQVGTDKDGNNCAVEVNPGDVMCGTGKYVEWKYDVPWGVKFKVKRR